jgi:hypothetical protein
MANQNILTDYFKVTQSQQDYYAPVATLPAAPYPPVVSVYCFLGGITPWPNDNSPPTPTKDQQYLKSVYKQIFAAKQIKTNLISLVITRFDWTSGTVYDYYQDNIDLTGKDNNGLPLYKFYVKNKYNQVFKCLWNNNGGTSTYEPVFAPGSYLSNNIYYGSDGYKWKYMYTIDAGSAQKFMDSNWMPVPIDTIQSQIYSGETLDPTGPILWNGNPNIYEAQNGTAGYGDIEVINIVTPGTGYNPTTNAITVTITGDGFGAAANVVFSQSSNTITDITINNSGTNYTYANVSITSTLGSGATAIAPVSPIGGHGYDPASELGVSHIMYTCEFNNTESVDGVIMVPTDIEYRQVGLLFNPLAKSTYPYFANASIYNTTTLCQMAPAQGNYNNYEIVYQGNPGTVVTTNLATIQATSSFSAIILDFSSDTNVLSLININGTPVINFPIYGVTTKTNRTLLTYTSPDFINFSGYMAYIENRSPVQRSIDGIEQFKFVLGY